MTGKKDSKFMERLAEIITIGNTSDRASRIYDIISLVSIVANLIVTLMNTFDNVEAAYGPVLHLIESITVAFFAADCVLRIITAKYSHPGKGTVRAVLRYIFSFNGIVDILSFVPFYLPLFFPSGAAVFKIFRVMRIFRIFRINEYYDSLNVIMQVIINRRQQLLSSVFIILIMMLASSMCMYSIENKAQPDVFSNAFSGIWWAASTLLTVGYGDIYPITAAGKTLGIIIAFLGVGMVAIPTGIISAGFVEQYAQIQKLTRQGAEADIHFIRVHLTDQDAWTGMYVRDLKLPGDIILAAIHRGSSFVTPKGGTKLKNMDTLVLAAEPYKDNWNLDMKEIDLLSQNPWNNKKVMDLDISRQTMLVMVKRGDQVIIPRGNTVLREGDRVLMYTRTSETQ